MTGPPRDHGGNLDRAVRQFGAGSWLDLSTGINARAYPVPTLSGQDWAALPTRSAVAELEAEAARYYQTQAPITALSGAQAAIQIVPRLARPGRACVVGPTYNEHAAALLAQGWSVETVTDPKAALGADLLIVVNPNNPDGRRWSPASLMTLRGRVGLLVVDESFADTEPGVSLAPDLTGAEDDIVVLRSFGKFFGLAGLRLGFLICGTGLVQTVRGLAGPWAVSGPAIAIGCQALADRDWQSRARQHLSQDADRLDALAAQAGWNLVGGTALFRTYDTPDAMAAQNRLATAHVWSRIFPYSDRWIRLGLPGSEQGWQQLAVALQAR